VGVETAVERSGSDEPIPIQVRSSPKFASSLRS
jgi:hypothetical protein